ncbi:MAG: hypothetical protein F6K58_20465 [Symploca sp. SIO2E9]|nr:hypothetical protein [Symploca sp. SIO2E9]
MKTSLEQKLNARGRYQLEHNEFDGDIEVLIGTKKQLSPKEEEELKTKGYRLRFAVGNVISGVVSDAETLAEVAVLPFVRKIELSMPMYTE